MKSPSEAKPPVAVRERFVSSALVAVLLFGLPLVLASVPRTFADGDVSWHVAAGRWILAHGAIPTTDPFSFTAAGRPWVAMEWLADLIYAGAYNLAGYDGLATIVAAALMALHAIVFAQLRRIVGPLGITATIVALDIVLSPFIIARPHVLVWPLLAAWTVLLVRAAEQERAPPLWSALIPLVWTNIHGSFPLAVAIGAAIAFDALIKAKWVTLRQWTVFGLVSLVAILLNANGLAGLLRPFHIAGLEMLPSIVEWQPSSPSLTPQFYAILLLTMGALLAIGVKIPLGRLVLLLAMLALAFSQLRHQSWLAIVAAIILPPLLGKSRWGVPDLRPYWLLGALLLVVRVSLPIRPPEDAAYPRGLLAAVPSDLRTQPVLNDYTFGGPLILAGIKPYIDGRSEIYGDAFFADYKAIGEGDWGRFNRAVRRYGIRWTMLSRNNKRLIQQLDSSPAWRRAYSDKIGVIHVRVT